MRNALKRQADRLMSLLLPSDEAAAAVCTNDLCSITARDCVMCGSPNLQQERAKCCCATLGVVTCKWVYSTNCMLFC